SGASGAYGDGSAGALTVSVGNTLDLSTVAGVNSLAGKANLQFTNITIAGTLIVPSGTVLRATGSVAISGTVTVLPAAQDNGTFSPHQGIAMAPAASVQGGVGLALLQAAALVEPELYGGGGGARPATNSGGAGGGAFAIYAQGAIRVFAGGIVQANGQAGVNPNTAGLGIVGAGGGGGGVVVLLCKGTLTLNGSVLANGGAGASGFDGNGGNTDGGGGGGGGGVVHLLAPSISVTGAAQANGGPAGANAGTGATINSGGGGGAAGGSGGNGGSTATGAPSSGATGYVIQTIAPSPENLIR
ncbi:MAG TPA: hypothetical protein VGE07_03895, partial [Herpetosiphonaceae bacterium]